MHQQNSFVQCKYRIVPSNESSVSVNDILFVLACILYEIWKECLHPFLYHKNESLSIQCILFMRSEVVSSTKNLSTCIACFFHLKFSCNPLPCQHKKNCILTRNVSYFFSLCGYVTPRDWFTFRIVVAPFFGWDGGWLPMYDFLFCRKKYQVLKLNITIYPTIYPTIPHRLLFHFPIPLGEPIY